MATKNIAIMEDVYNLLLEQKRENESFSDELRRLASGKKASLMDAYGAWSDLGEETLDQIEESIKRRRRISTELRKKRTRELFK